MSVKRVSPSGTRKRTANGSLAERVQRDTDGAGRAHFDLDGLGKGRVYVVLASPYGHEVQSQEFGLAGEYPLLAGTLEVELKNGVDGQPYSGQDVDQPYGRRQSDAGALFCIARKEDSERRSSGNASK